MMRWKGWMATFWTAETCGCRWRDTAGPRNHLTFGTAATLSPRNTRGEGEEEEEGGKLT